MSMISTVDVQTRLDINELLNRYCHYLDHGQGDEWAGLFTRDALFEIKGHHQLEGQEELRTLPPLISSRANGMWRSQITNILIDHGPGRKELLVRAYGLVTDWGNDGRPHSFLDYTMLLRNSCRWQIAHLSAQVLKRARVPA